MNKIKSLLKQKKTSFDLEKESKTQFSNDIQNTIEITPREFEKHLSEILFEEYKLLVRSDFGFPLFVGQIEYHKDVNGVIFYCDINIVVRPDFLEALRTFNNSK